VLTYTIGNLLMIILKDSGLVDDFRMLLSHRMWLLSSKFGKITPTAQTLMTLRTDLQRQVGEGDPSPHLGWLG